MSQKFLNGILSKSDLTLDDGSGASPKLILKNSSDETWEIFNGTHGVLNFYENSDLRLSFAQGGDATFAGDVQTSKLQLSSDTEHFVSFTTTSLINTSTTVDTTGISGRRVDIYAYDDIKLRAGTSDSIYLMSGGSDTLTLDDSSNATFAGDVTVGGDIIINGTTTTLNTTTVEVEDNILQLNTTQGSPDTATAATSGISVYRGDGVTQASLIFDDGDDRWDLTNHLRIGGQLTVDSHVQTTRLYNTGDLTVLNKAGSAWLTFADRNTSATEVVYDLANVGTLSASGNATFVGDVKGATFNSIENAASGGFPASKDYLLAGTGDRGGGLIINDISGARHAITAGGYDLTFSKETNNGSGTLGQDIWMRANATDGAGNVNSIDFFKETNFSGAITTTSATGIKIDTTGNAILELDGASGNTEAIIFKHSGTEISRISHSNSTDLVFSTGSSVTTALTLDASQNATFAGNVESQNTFILNYNNAGNKWQQLFDGSNGWNLRYYNGTSWSSNYINVNTSGNATFAGTISATNFSGSSSGTNTGDQTLPTDFVSAANGGTFAGPIAIDDSAGAAWLSTMTNSANNGHGLLIQAGGTSGTRYITQWKDAAGTERFHMDDTGEAYFQNSITSSNFSGSSSGTNTGDQTLPTDFVSKANGGTFDGNITVQDITMGADDRFRHGSYLELSYGSSNTSQFTFNADYDGGQTGTYTPHYSGTSSSGMSVVKMPSGGVGGLDFYVKKHGTTSGSHNISTFTKILELNQNGTSTFGGNVTAGNLDINGTADFSGKVEFQGDAAIEGGSGYGVFKGYSPNNNHFISVRGIVANSSTLSITGGHQTTFVEHADAANEGWYFKSFTTGTYREIARIDGLNEMYLGGNQVYHEGHKPTLAELGAAADTVVNQTDFVSKASGGTFGGDLTIQHASTPAIKLKDTTDPDLEVRIRAANNYGYFEVDNTNTSASSRLQMKIDGVNTATFMPNSFQTNTQIIISDENTPGILDIKRKNTGGAILNGEDIGRIDFVAQDTVDVTSETNVGRIIVEADGDYSSTSKKSRYKFFVNTGTSLENALTIGSDKSLTVEGNLTVSGTTTTLNTQTVEVEDNILQLNTTPGSPDTATAATSGISVYRGDGVTQASLIFDDADDTWDLTDDLVVDGFVTAKSYLEAFSYLYLRSDIRLLNKQANGWLTFADRNTAASEAVYDLAHVGTITTSGDINTSGDVHIDEGSTSAFQTTNKLRFGNTSWNNNIGLESYWMKFGCNQNEGFKFADSTGNMLLQLNGGNSTSGNGAFSATFKGSIIPAADASLTLGTGSLRWNFAYINNALTVTDGNFNTTTSFKFNKGLVVEGSVDSGGTDMGYYQSAGTNIVLKGDSAGRSGIFFESEKDGTNINDPSDYGFIQFHSYGYDNTTGESAAMVIGVSNDSADKLILQAPYNGGVMIGYKDATSGVDLTLSEVIHSNSSSYNNSQWDAAEANVNADWNATSGDAQILNKPTILVPEFFEEKFAYQSNDSNTVYTPMVKGGLYGTNASSVTGAIRIDLPTYKSAGMINFYVDIYEYNTGDTVTFRISGYAYNDTDATWHNCSVVNLSDNNNDYNVRFISDTANSKQCVTIGEVNTNWTYPQVLVRDAFSGFNTSESEWLASWNITFVTSFVGTVRHTFSDNLPYADWDRLEGKPTLVPFSGSWNGANMPGSRFGGYQANGGEIVFQQDNPGSGRMSVMTDGNFHAGENGGFYSLYSSSSYNSKAGFNTDANGVLQFTTNGTSALADFDGRVIAGNGSQAANNDAMLTLNATSFSGLDIKSARTEGNIGGLRYYDTASDSVPEAQFLVEVDGSYNFYNGTNGAELRLKIKSDGTADFKGTVQAPYITANNPSGAADGSAQEVARFVNTSSGATSSYMYIGASSGTDWRLGKNINGTASNTNFAITKHSGTTLFFEIDGVGNTTTYGTGNFGNGVSLSGNLNFSGGTGKKIVLGSQRAYTLPAQNTKMRILTLANHTSCRVYIDSSENSYNQPIVLDIFYNSQSSAKPVIHRNNSYQWHAHSNDIRFTSDTSGHIYAEKVAHTTARTVNIRKVEEFKGTVTLLDGSTTQTGGGANEVIEGAFGGLQAYGNIDVKSSGVIKMNGTEVISAARAISATAGTFTSKIIAPKLSIQNQINTSSSNLEINYENGDGTTTNFKDFYIRDGKNGLILNIQGSSKISTFSGPVKTTAIRTDIYQDSASNILFTAGNTTTGASRSLNLRHSGSSGDPSASDDANSTGITWGQRSDSNPYYIIYPQLENWNSSGNYSKLTLAWHTGIKIGAASQYGGTRFYNNSPDISGAGVIMNVGVGSNNVGVEYDLAVSGETTLNDTLNVKGNILLTGDATTTSQGRMIDFTGFDKEGTTDFSDRAYISHTVNTGGHAGSVLVISSQNDSNDGIAFATHASSLLKHNGDALFSEGHLPTWSEIESKPTTFTPSQHTQGASTITSGVLDAARLPANLQNVASTSDSSGIYFRAATESISGEGWCTGHYAYNHNDGFLFNNRNSSNTASPVFHIGGYNNAGYAGYAAQDSIITLTRSDGTKTTGSAYAGKGLSSSTYYTNIIKTTTKTVLRDAQGLHEFTGNAATPTGSFSVGSASDTNQRNLHLHAYVANKSSTLKCTDGNLHIDSADGHALYLNFYAGASTNINFGNSNSGVCGTLSSSGLLRVGNDVVAYYSFSDKRLKKDIKTTENNLDKILSLRPVEYKWKEGPREGVKEIGLIAQEVEKVVPEVVRVQSRHDDENYDEGIDYKQVDYEHLVSTLIGAMQEQQDQINDLKKEIQTLKSK